MSWKDEPYRSAKQITGNKTTALILIDLIRQVKEIGLTKYPEIEVILEGVQNE